MLLSSSRSEIVTRDAIGMSSGKGGNVEPEREEGFDNVDAILTVPVFGVLGKYISQQYGLK